MSQNRCPCSKPSAASLPRDTAKVVCRSSGLRNKISPPPKLRGKRQDPFANRNPPPAFRYGREVCTEFDESSELEQADFFTIGNSCRLQVRERQQLLQGNDCFLPRIPRENTELTREMPLTASNGVIPAVLLDSWEHPIGENSHAWSEKLDASLTLSLTHPVTPQRLRIIRNSDLNRIDQGTVSVRCPAWLDTAVPAMRVRKF